MTIEVMNAVWRESISTGRARLVLLAIADQQGDLGAWPSIATLAKKVNASERSVKRDIQELIDLGELRVEFQAAPTSGQYKTNRYWVELPGVTKNDSGVTESTSEVTDWVNRGDSVGTQNLIKPLIEPLLKKPHRIPQDWSASVALLKWATERHPYIDALILSENFKNHWLSAGTSSALKVDWDAAFRTWVGKAAMDLPEWKKQGNPIETRKKIDQDKELTAKLIEEQREKSSTPPPTCQHGQSIIRCRKCLLGIN